LIPVLINEIKNMKNKNTILENEILHIKNILGRKGIL